MNQNQPTDGGALEVLTPSALESIERASIDVQVSTAHRFPRSLEQFKKRALDMVQQDLETAESCIYSRPVGKGDDGKQKYAEGASIRMAEIVAACYGNIRFGARIVEQTERYVKAEGVAHDLESNTAGKSEAMESTVKRDGRPYDERMRIVVAKACLSKALRDAIFRVVPRALCKSVYDAAQKVIAGQNLPIEARRKKAQQWLTGLRVEDARVFAVLSVKGWSEVGEEQLLLLTGLKTAMKDNEITLNEAFPPITTANTSDIAGPGAPTKLAPEPKKETKPESKAEPPDGDLGPVCKYCGTPVEDMSKHMCEGMRAAIAAKTQAETKQNPGLPKPEATQAEGDPLKQLMALAEPAGITEKTLIAFCKLNKIAKDEQNALSQLSDAKLAKLVGAWSGIVEELKALQAKAAA